MRLISKLSRICKIYLFLVIMWLCTTMVSYCKILFLIYWLSDLHRTSSQIHEIYVLQRKLLTSINCCFFECFNCALLPFSKKIMIEMKKKTLMLIRFFLWTERKQTTTSGGSCLTPTPAASITTTPPVRKPSGTARKTVISSPLPSYR